MSNPPVLNADPDAPKQTGRPKDPTPREWKRVGFLAQPELVARVDEAARAQGLDRSDVLRLAAAAYVEAQAG
jgi:hypothetical protein